MSDNGNLLDAAAASLGEAERDHAELLTSVVTVARALFGAAAASVFLLDEQSDELVFEAVSGAVKTTSWVSGSQPPAVSPAGC